MSDGWIYFVQSEEGPIKIGHSVSPSYRLASLQTASFKTLTLIGLTQGSRWDEQRLHDQLAEHSLGREWYSAHPDILAAIEEPVAPINEMLEAAVTAREHIRIAIKALRLTDPETARHELSLACELLVDLGLREVAA